MSSAIYVTFGKDEGVGLVDWQSFCTEHGISYSPNTVGQNVFYAGVIAEGLGHGEVEIKFGDHGTLPQTSVGRPDFAGAAPPDYAESVTFSTFFMGPAMPEVAEIARAFWQRFGGAVNADEELRSLFTRARARRGGKG